MVCVPPSPVISCGERGGHKRGGLAGKEFTAEGYGISAKHFTAPQTLPGLGKPWAAQPCHRGCLFLGGVSWARQSGDPVVAQERGWACRRPPSSLGLEPQHRRALCSHEGPARGHCARAEFVSQPRFLSVVLKESVESADWAVLLHPRPEAAAPGRERREAPQGSHLVSRPLTPPRLQVQGSLRGMGGSLQGDTSPGQGAAAPGCDSPWALPLPENPAPSSSASVSHPSSPQACREGERRQLVDTELVRIGRVMTGHPSHPAPALALTPTSCHPAIPRRSLEHSHPLIPPPACHFLCSNVTLSARLP